MFQESSLESVVLPSTLKTIGRSVFHGCEKLKSVKFPDGLKKISTGAFTLSGLESATFPASLRTIS